MPAIWPSKEPGGRARAIPIDLLHCPTPHKPGRKASNEQWQQWRKAKEQSRLPRRGAERLALQRAAMDAKEVSRDRQLIAVGDGGYTNRETLKRLPPRTTFIGRIRRDAKLYFLPAARGQGPGRKRTYGELAPTPEALRQDENTPWTQVEAWAAGERRVFRVKTLAPLRWRCAGGERHLRLLVIAALGYRLRAGGRVLYREPAYLLCTDPDLPVEQVLQQYIWRTELEGNFRDQKTLLGVGEAQVRTTAATTAAPVLQTAAYAYMLLAGQATPEGRDRAQRTRPRWQKRRPEGRLTTAQCLSLLRAELWGLAIDARNFSGFAIPPPCTTKPQISTSTLHAAVYYASQ